ncbi:MAG: outer membrane beta-barrel protein [Bradyrhizobium sp.]|nr:outer membrane beta-barrel protein [Bradyrhizobium sp.]
MKKKIIAAAALLIAGTTAGSAADLSMATKAPAYVAPVWSWTGFYIGGHVGAGWGTTESTITSITGLGPTNFALEQNNRSGVLGGGQIGYNFQSGWAVFGIQADIAGMDVKGTAPCFIELTCTSKSDWLATVSGRFGGVVADKTLIYAKGGAAWMNTTHTVAIPAAGIFGAPGAGTASASAENTDFGWLLGFGAEYAFSPNWTAFIEYDYMQFDTKSATLNFVAIPGAALNVDYKDKLSIAKIGVNYKF